MSLGSAAYKKSIVLYDTYKQVMVQLKLDCSD